MANLCNNANAVAFVNKHRVDCATIATMLKIPVENILGLAAHESQYGTGRIAREYNNYFSMHAPAPLQTGAVAPLGNAKIKVATYDSFLQCGQSFAQRFGSTLIGKSDPLDFANALIRCGFNSGNSANGGRTGYAQLIVDIVKVVKTRMECTAK